MDFSMSIFKKIPQQKRKPLKGNFAGVAGLIFITLAATNHALADSSNSSLVPSSPALPQSSVIPTSPALPQSPVIPTSQTSAYSTSCTIPHAGAPSCEAESNAGSSAIAPDIPYHVGNPIDVVSGNKYQRDIDYKAFNSGLTLVRHYNSSLADHDTGFGQGWRHTYQVFLTRPGPGKLNIVQSDGRLIEFTQLEGTQEPNVYLPHNRSDGVLVAAEKSVWYLPDGRTFTFNGSYLTEIDFGDHRGKLTLHYRQRRVDTVTDSRGGVLKFVYTSRQSSLPRFGSDDAVKPVGSIESVVMPNGDTIRYKYGQNNNLVLADYPDGERIDYDYRNPNWKNYLTSRKTNFDRSDSIWEYDSAGLATKWSNTNSGVYLEVNRSEFSRTDSENSAAVVYSDGRTSHYNWIKENGSSSDFLLSCKNCYLNTIASIANHSKYSENSPPSGNLIFSNISRNENSRRGDGSTWNHIELNEQDTSTTIDIKTNRLGKIIQLKINEKKFSFDNHIPSLSSTTDCVKNLTSTSLKEFSASPIAHVAAQRAPCDLDSLVIAEFVNEFEKNDSMSNWPYQSRRRGTGVVISPTVDHFCILPVGKSCADLFDDLEMARLSRCSYGSISCTPTWTAVSPTSLQLDPLGFSFDGFHAVLYRNNSTGDFVLAFRGTDGGLEDLVPSVVQGRGTDVSYQYQLAFELANNVRASLPTSQLSFTGHSLGGGLATLAALSTSAQATVFNSASLHPDTAAFFNITNEYSLASNYVEAISTQSDLITRGQSTQVADMLNVHEAPGLQTTIPDPYDHWVNNRIDNGIWFPGERNLAYHSIDAVIQSIETLLHRHCQNSP